MKSFVVTIGLLALALILSVPAAATEIVGGRIADCPRVGNFDYDTAPSFVDSAAVEYPSLARIVPIEGVVVVDVIVLDSGLPCDAVVVSGVNPLLNNAAMLAANMSRYAPATSGGTAVPGVCRVSYGFWTSDPRFQRQAWPQAPLTHPLVSELGTASKKKTPVGIEYLEILYEGVPIRGDMPVSLFNEVTAQVKARAGGDRPILHINNYLSLPREWDPDYACQWQEKGDISVDVAEVPEGTDKARTRCTYRFYYRGQQVESSDVVRCFHGDFPRD